MLKLQRLNISSSAVWELIRKSVLDARESWTSAHHGLRKCLQMQVKAESYKEAAMCEHDAETLLSSLGQSSFQIHKWPGLFIAEGSRCWTGLNRPFTNQQHSAHHKTKKLQSLPRMTHVWMMLNTFPCWHWLKITSQCSLRVYQSIRVVDVVFLLVLPRPRGPIWVHWTRWISVQRGRLTFSDNIPPTVTDISGINRTKACVRLKWGFHGSGAKMLLNCTIISPHKSHITQTDFIRLKM